MRPRPDVTRPLAQKANRPALRIAVIYALAGGAWILFSDSILNALIADPDRVSRLQTYKGWFYVGVTALLVFWLVRGHLRRRARDVRALVMSEQRLALALEASGQGLWDWSLANGELHFAGDWVRALGYESSEVAELQFWRERIHPDDLDRVRQALEDHQAGRTPNFDEEYRLRTRSGDWIWIQDLGRVVERDAEARALRMVGTHMDVTARKRAEEQRRAVEERFTQLAENIAAVFWMRDPDGRMVYVSPGYDAIFGRSSAPLLNDAEAFHQAVAIEDRERVRRALREMFEQGDPGAFDLEYRIRTAQGERWIWDKAFVVRDGAGKVIRFCGLSRDVTERRAWAAEVEELNERLSQTNAELERSNAELTEANRGLLEAYRNLSTESERRDLAEQSLRESEERFRATFDQAAVGLAHLTLGGRYALVNRRFCEILGYTESELTKQTFQAVTHEKDLADSLRTAEAVAARPGAVSSKERRLYRKDGRVVWCRITSTVVRDAHGDPRYFLDVIEDITTAREAEARTLRMAAALEHAGEAVAIAERSGAILYVNESFTSQTGYSPEEALGRNPVRLLVGEENRRFFEEELAALRLGRPWRGGLRLKARDGHEFDAEASIAPILDEQGEISHYVAVMRDVTNRLRLEERLRQTQKMEALGTLAGGIAHDFNNLLTSIMGFTELAQRRSADPDLDRYLERILNAIKRGADMVRQIMAFSRSREAGFSPVEFQAVVRQTLDLLEGAVLSNVRVEERLEAGGVLVMAEPSRLHQVVMNLCVNGLHAMRKSGGVLSVSLEASDDGGGAGNGPGLLLTVRDTGTGMDEATKLRVFEPFFTTKEPGEGTGMGLSVVHGIVTGWGGAIEVDSTPGAGSEFRVWLPVPEAGNQGGEPPPPVDAA